MPKDEKVKTAKRMVVEEINPVETPTEEKAPLEEVKEKVGELQDITQHLSEDVEKSAEVQVEIVKAAEKVETQVVPEEPVAIAQPSFKQSSGTNPLIIII